MAEGDHRVVPSILKDLAKEHDKIEIDGDFERVEHAIIALLKDPERFKEEWKVMDKNSDGFVKLEEFAAWVQNKFSTVVAPDALTSAFNYTLLRAHRHVYSKNFLVPAAGAGESGEDTASYCGCISDLFGKYVRTAGRQM